MDMMMHFVSRLQYSLLALSVAWTVAETGGSASAQDDARMRQLRLLCAQLSGDLTDPGGIAAFRRCLTTHDPLQEIRRDNNLGGTLPDRPNAAPPAGFGRNSRRLVGEGIDRFQQIEGGVFYIVDKTGKLWRGTGDADARLLDQNVTTFRVVDGHLFVQSTDGTLWRAKLDGTERTMIDRTVSTFQPISAGIIYVLGTDGKLWRENGHFSNRTEVDRTVRDFQAIDATDVFVLGIDQQLWREAGTMQSRSLIASKITAFQYIPGGDTAYVQTSDGTLWRKSGNDAPQQVDNAVAAFQAVDLHLAYVLGNDGRLWREPGGRNQAVLVDRDVLVTSGKGAIQVIDSGHVLLLDNQHTLWAESMPDGR
jgi:hypothetical protein